MSVLIVKTQSKTSKTKKYRSSYLDQDLQWAHAYFNNKTHTSSTWDQSRAICCICLRWDYVVLKSGIEPESPSPSDVSRRRGNKQAFCLGTPANLRGALTFLYTSTQPPLAPGPSYKHEIFPDKYLALMPQNTVTLAIKLRVLFARIDGKSVTTRASISVSICAPCSQARSSFLHTSAPSDSPV